MRIDGQRLIVMRWLPDLWAECPEAGLFTKPNHAERGKCPELLHSSDAGTEG